MDPVKAIIIRKKMQEFVNIHLLFKMKITLST